MQLLQRAVDASRDVFYAGTKVLTSPTSSAYVDIWHVPGRGTTSKVESGSLDSDTPSGQLEGDPVDDGLDDLVLATLTHGYSLAVMGDADCVGRSTSVVEARSLSTHQLAAKLWLDDATGLLLRRQLFDDAGHIVRSTSYVDIKVGSAAARNPDSANPPSPDGGSPPVGKKTTAPAMTVPAAKLLTDAQVSQLRAQGWPLPDVLPGGMQRYEAYELTDASGPVIQLSFSNGLFSSSLFVQHGQLDVRNLRGVHPEQLGDASVYASSGLYRTLTWAGGDTVYTLVSDAPASVADSAVTALPHRAPDTSVLGRIGRGIARVASWVNPFD